MAFVQPMTFSPQDELPHLNDDRYIRFMQEYAAVITKNSPRVLRGHSKGFIGCKFSALAYLLISMVWVDDSLPTYESKLKALTSINFVENYPKKIREKKAKLKEKKFHEKKLELLFLQNRTTIGDTSKQINTWEDIHFDDGVAFLGIIAPRSGVHEVGQILHYFIIVQRHTSEPYKIISSYGSENVSYYQFETLLYPATFNNFVQSLTKELPKSIPDKREINNFMTRHFLNDRYKNEKRQNKTKEIDFYKNNVTAMVQFNGIFTILRSELDYGPSKTQLNEYEDVGLDGLHILNEVSQEVIESQPDEPGGGENANVFNPIFMNQRHPSNVDSFIRNEHKLNFGNGNIRRTPSYHNTSSKMRLRGTSASIVMNNENTIKRTKKQKK
jgi:hypothetical protein